MSASFEAKIRERRPEVLRLHKELSMARLLLLERAREQGGGGRVDPALLVDLVRLLERCEGMAGQYGMDLEEFDRFIHLMIQKVKRHRLIRHEGEGGRMGRFSPMQEDELERLKGRSERKR